MELSGPETSLPLLGGTGGGYGFGKDQLDELNALMNFDEPPTPTVAPSELGIFDMFLAGQSSQQASPQLPETLEKRSLPGMDGDNLLGLLDTVPGGSALPGQIESAGVVSAPSANATLSLLANSNPAVQVSSASLVVICV